MFEPASVSLKQINGGVVQLGGLEPPTSCSTDRRSNQLSYNCILRGPQKGVANGRKLGATPALWQGREATDYSRFEAVRRSFAGRLLDRPAATQNRLKLAQQKSPG